MEPIDFEVPADAYRHWQFNIAGQTATAALNVSENLGLSDSYALKLNSYDLSVDMELADIIQRLRFSRPEVRVLILTSARERVFCAGANIVMLAASTHPFKVNFCKYTNETRLYLEELSRESGVRTICALNGTASGGGYELALACDEIVLIDDGFSAVSLPEVPLLGVLPGTGGLTRLVDKRRVRRDHADFVATTAEGVRGKRARDWRLVDQVVPRSQFGQVVSERAAALAAGSDRPRDAVGVALESIAPVHQGTRSAWRHVTLEIDRPGRTAVLTMSAPEKPEPLTPETIAAAGSDLWALRAWRELDHALLHLRFNEPEVGVLQLKCRGDSRLVLAIDEALYRHRDHWLVRELLLHQRRVLRRLDLIAKSLFALIEAGSAFAGSMFELALAADRSYMLAGSDARVYLSRLNAGTLATYTGLSRLQLRFLGEPDRVAALIEREGSFDAQGALEAGLVTFAPDEIDWAEEIRLAVEERTSISPDALTGMEASLRFAGPETLATKIFGRLSAWQNWIFTRPNAIGEKGALTMYGKAQRPEFDFRRT